MNLLSMHDLVTSEQWSFGHYWFTELSRASNVFTPNFIKKIIKFQNLSKKITLVNMNASLIRKAFKC